MTPKRVHKSVILFFALPALILTAATSAFADCPNGTPPPGADSLQMLVIGDSIMWGQGLREDEKISTRVKCWLQEKTNREVNVHVEAHSGAIVSGSSQTPPLYVTSDGEVNLTSPTINEELDHAVSFYKSNQTSPALTLVNGCINDVGVKNLLAAATPLDDLRAQIRKSCGEDMQRLLLRVRNSFPQTQIVLTNYYPIVSAQTADNAFLRLLVKKLNNQRPEARNMSDKEVRRRLIAISEEWYRTSTATLAEAVVKTNLAAETSPAITFVEVEFGPEHVFAAPESLLWNFKYATSNATGFAKIVVVLSFGTAAYKPNDHVRDARVKSCETTFQKPKGIKESKEQKGQREDLFLICRYASLGHPNQMGALLYAEAIKGRLLPLIDKAGWKRDTNSHLTQQ
ncbi:MAG TPA: SGNH/GDSL hydrolase family protein [Pyrinomonadaceae bacterium]|nr:SGNH/GDSL hydrolase family protein [Pyrinomonadaceae bacterium]